MADLLPDGIYFDLSFEDYLAQPRISAGSLTRLMEGPASFWADSWMNPDREEPEESDAMLLGRAYHCARLEPDTYPRLYCRQLVPEDFGEGLLTTATQIGDALGELGLTKKKAGESVLDQARRLAEADPAAKIWHLELEDWQANLDGKTPIKPKAWAEIERDARNLRRNPEIEALVSCGAPEVSILWTEPETGARCKCRPDYLGPDWITHLKTWDNKAMGKPGNRAIADAFRFNGYYRTGWFYYMALSRIAPDDLPVFSSSPLTPVGESLAAAWKAGPAWQTWFLFQRRGGIPDIRAREVAFFDVPPGVKQQKIGASVEKFRHTPTVLARKADLEVMACLRAYAECLEIYGTEPWFPRDMIGRFEDDDFSSNWLDSVDDPR